MNLGVLRIDTRLMLPETRGWLIAGIAAGALGLAVVVALYSVIGRVIDATVAGSPLDAWWPALIALLLLRGALIWCLRLAGFRASSRTKVAIRDRMYEHALRLGPSLLDKKRTGELVNTAVNGMEWIEQLYGVYVIQFALAILTPVLLCLYLLTIDPVAAAAMVITIPLMPIFLSILAARFRRSSRRSAETNNRLSAQFMDALQGMTTLKMFNLSRARGEQMRAENEEQRQATMRLLWINQMMILWTDMGFGLGTTLVMTVVVAARLATDALTPGTAVALVLLSTEFWKPLQFIGQFFFAGGIGREIASKILAFLNELPPIADPPGARTPPPVARPVLRLEHVSFAYPGATRPAVNDVSFSVAPGEMVALVGHSGSGKTTIANLVMRFLQPASGTIALDGVASHEVTAEWMRRHVALVPQDPYLFYGTIAENLRLARSDASDDQLMAAVRAANLHRFVESLPQGLATMVGERGLAISGGQAQRLAIARALLKDAPIVVLDEPTSQIDLETETVIQEALDALKGTRSLLVIAHRLHTAARADRIIILEDGRIVEAGTPGELEARGGVWARMVAISRADERRAPVLVGGGDA